MGSLPKELSCLHRSPCSHSHPFFSKPEKFSSLFLRCIYLFPHVLLRLVLCLEIKEPVTRTREIFEELEEHQPCTKLH